MTTNYVWDRFVRTFHWTLVAAFAIAWLSAEENMTLHAWSGYVVGALIVARVAWGFVGSPHARFSDFLYRPAAVTRYLRGLINGRVEHYRGHNPAGGWMVIALLTAVALTVVSGIAVYGLEGHGPLAMVAASEEAEEWWEEVHEICANLTLTLVGLHVVGVVVSSWRHRENLVRAMLTGRKPV